MCPNLINHQPMWTHIGVFVDLAIIELQVTKFLFNLPFNGSTSPPLISQPEPTILSPYVYHVFRTLQSRDFDG